MRDEMESLWSAMKGTHYKRTIDRLTKSIRSTRNLEEAMQAALDMVVNAVHAQAGTFWYYNRFQDGRITPRAVFGGGDLSGISLLPGEGVAGQVIESGKATIIADCQSDPRWAGKVDAKTGFTTRSMICVPLKLEDTVFGSIQIINKTDNMAYDEKDLEFVERLAEEISQLLKYQGLLEDFVEYARSGNPAASMEVTARELFCSGSAEEMEYCLHSMEEFSGLMLSEQKKVLNLIREIRTIFERAGY